MSYEQVLIDIVRKLPPQMVVQVLDYARFIQSQAFTEHHAIAEVPITYHGSAASVIHSDPEILGGTPVFVGTRVPFRTLLDYLIAGDPLEEFLDHFPTVSREQAIAALQLSQEMLLAHAHPT